MGRKTWESIPERFRPLKGRTNIVISRSYPEVLSSQDFASHDQNSKVEVGSIHGAVASLGTSTPRKVFAIGGAQIYEAALKLQDAKRILLTRILDDFECDTFFPLKLGDDGKADGWERKDQKALENWVGITVPEGVQEENGTKYVFEMWEKVDSE